MRLNHVLATLSMLSSLWGVPAGSQIYPSTLSQFVAQTLVTEVPATVTAFVAVNVIPMDIERVLTDQTVLVEGGRISALGPASQIQVPAGAIRIDGQGKYLLPGLTDMHVHLGISNNDRYDSLTAESRLFLWLASGVTTIRNMDYLEESNLEGFRLKGSALLWLKRRAAAGELWSPRIYTSAQWAPRHYLGQIYPKDSLLVTMPPPPRLDSVAAYVAMYKAAGYDHIKSYAHEPPGVWDSMVAAAQRVGLPVVGHVNGSRTGKALTAFRSIEHQMEYTYLAGGRTQGTPWDTSYTKLRSAAETIQRAGIWISPTIMMAQLMRSAPSRFVKVLQDAGVNMLLGTDDQNLSGSLIAVHRELEAFVRLGLTPYQALVTAIRNPAAYFDTLDDTGTVSVGKRADLVLLAGNPLSDIRHTRRPVGVMIGGRWLGHEDIDQRLPIITAMFTSIESRQMTQTLKWRDEQITSP